MIEIMTVVRLPFKILYIPRQLKWICKLVQGRWNRSKISSMKYISLCLLSVIVCSTVLWYCNLKQKKEETKVNVRRFLPGRGFNENFNLMIWKAEITLKENLRFDKGSGCEMPLMDPFSDAAMEFDADLPKITCPGRNWHSECRVINEILDTHINIVCTYRDIIFEHDFSYSYGSPVKVVGAKSYHLNRSDHARVACRGSRYGSILELFMPSRWSGNVAGFRSTVHRKPSPKGREDSLNVMIFAFDSTARIGFIRKMPKSFKFLIGELEAIVLKNYNIVGHGTKAALFPILTGKNMYELPNTRILKKGSTSCDVYPLLFYKLKEDGYRTAYFEDRTEIGTFQFWVNGFRQQPTDHYLRAFFQDNLSFHSDNKYCVGDTPQYNLMMNLTSQFMRLNGKKFIFTFVSDISHDDFNMVTTADDDFVDFLKGFLQDGHLDDTLLIVMGDHGPRFSKGQNRRQGRLEERLPLMAFVLPDKLKEERRNVVSALEQNVDSLTTPYDIHATLLDAVGLRKHWVDYKIPGADHPRSMTLLEPIPLNRSCSEAGVEPHWCVCVLWRNISQSDPIYRRACDALVNYVNALLEPVSLQCSRRTLTNITWVMLKFAEGERFVSWLMRKRIYQVKVTLGPGVGDYEATMTYIVKSRKFEVDSRDISRTNRYGDEPACILKTHPYLSPYCYCLDHSE